jgi:hypothetical protein
MTKRKLTDAEKADILENMRAREDAKVKAILGPDASWPKDALAARWKLENSTVTPSAVDDE